MLQEDNGYYFGIGAFETMMICNREPILVKQHLKRLNKTLQFLQLSQFLSEPDVERYLKEQDISNGILKIAVSEKNISYSARSNKYTAKTYQNGFYLCISPFLRNESSPLTYHKTINYAENIIARRFAEENQADEVLFLNTKGEISEGSFTNIFFVREKRLYTPKRECGLLPGVFREMICENEKVEKAVIRLEDIKNFEECFVTNSILGIMKVNAIENHIFQGFSVIEKLQDKYSHLFAGIISGD